MNTSHTLEQLEAHSWPPAPSDSSPMVMRCHALRKKPLANLSAGDCRLLIGQDIGTNHLVPLALAFLEGKPLIEGDYYPGDLLLALFGVSKEHWLRHPESHARLLEVARRASTELTKKEAPLGSELKLLKELNAHLAKGDA